MILGLKGGELGKVIDLYFLSFRPKNGVENVKFNLIASGDTNLLFPPTWVSNWRRARSLRKYKFLRLAEREILAAGETDFVFVDSQTGRPRAIPESVSGLFELLTPNSESGELETFIREHL